MKLPPLNALRVFETAARKGSFVSAGEELGVTSAAVSLQVRNLEEWLGRELFIRHNNQIRLTDAGEDLFHNAARSLAEIATYTKSVRQASVKRPLVLSAVPSVAERWLPQVVSAWANYHPLKIVSNEDQIDLERDDIDLHISYGNGSYNDYVQTPLLHDAVVPMTADSFTGTLQNGALIDIDWGRRFTRAPKWSAWFLKHGIEPPALPPELIAPSTSIGLALAEQSAGIVLGQKALAKTALERGSLRILDNREMPLQSQYYAVFAHHKQKSALLQRLLRTLQSVADFA